MPTIEAAWGKARDFAVRFRVNDPFRAFPSGLETDVSLDEVKLERLAAVDNFSTQVYSATILGR